MTGRGKQRAASLETRMEHKYRALEAKISGRKVTPSPNPTAFVERPWNSWTYEATNTTTSAFQVENTTVLEVITQIANKNSLSAIEKCKVKIQSCSVWLTAAKDLLQPDLECNFFEISGDGTFTQNPRSVQRDKGTLNRPAKCGYVYPVVDSKDIVGIDEGARKVVSSLGVTVGSVITVRVHVLWQSSA